MLMDSCLIIDICRRTRNLGSLICYYSTKSFFLMYVCIDKTFLCRIPFAPSNKFWYVGFPFFCLKILINFFFDPLIVQEFVV